jgi:hypothetical protein
LPALSIDDALRGLDGFGGLARATPSGGAFPKSAGFEQSVTQSSANLFPGSFSGRSIFIAPIQDFVLI